MNELQDKQWKMSMNLGLEYFTLHSITVVGPLPGVKITKGPSQYIRMKMPTIKQARENATSGKSVKESTQADILWSIFLISSQPGVGVNKLLSSYSDH